MIWNRCEHCGGAAMGLEDGACIFCAPIVRLNRMFEEAIAGYYDLLRFADDGGMAHTDEPAAELWAAIGIGIQ